MEDIIKEIRRLKFYIALGAFSLFLTLPISIAQVWLIYKSCKPYLDNKPSGYYKSEYQEFSNQANNLLAEMKYDDLVKVAGEQVSKRPTDPYGYYYLGMGYYYLGKYGEAVEKLQKASQLAPWWKPESIQPVIQKAQEAMNNKKQ